VISRLKAAEEASKKIQAESESVVPEVAGVSQHQHTQGIAFKPAAEDYYPALGEQKEPSLGGYGRNARRQCWTKIEQCDGGDEDRLFQIFFRVRSFGSDRQKPMRYRIASGEYFLFALRVVQKLLGHSE